MKKNVLLLFGALMITSCGTQPSTGSETPSPSLEESIEYDELQPVVYCSFDKLDENGNFYDEVSGDALFPYGQVVQSEGMYGKAAVFDGQSCLELASFKGKIKKNEPHTIVAFVKADLSKITSQGDYVVGGFGEYRHLSDSRLMIYHNQLCVTSYDVCNFYPIPSDINENWRQIALTYDGEYFDMYIDGEFAVDVKANNGIKISSSALYIGGFANNILGWIGEIDEFYVFDDCLINDDLERLWSNEGVIKVKEPNNQSPVISGLETFDINTSELVKGKWNDFVYIYNRCVLPFRIYIPVSYGERRKLPVLLHLHGDGSNGAGIGSLVGDGEFTLVSKVMKEEPETIIIVPNAGTPWLGVPNDVRTVYPYKSYDMENDATPSKYLEAADQLLKDVEEHLYVDTSRIYINGYSRGAMATWYMLYAYPNRFAAAFICSGAGDEFIGSTLAETPVWAFMSNDDPLVSYTDFKKVCDSVSAAGGELKLTTYTGLGHGLAAGLLTEPNTTQWLFSHTKER